MPDFKSESTSNRVQIGENLIWCNDVKNDTKNHLNWIKQYYDQIFKHCLQLCYKQYVQSNDCGIDDYTSAFNSLNITFNIDTTVSFIFSQPNGVSVTVIYNSRRRPIAVK